MATFYGGEQLVSVFSLASGFVANNIDVYTVPAGFYASIYIVSVSGSGVLQVRDPAQTLFPSSVLERDSILLASNSKLRTTNINGSYHVTIKVYKNP